MRRRSILAARREEQAGFIVGSSNYDALPKSYTVLHDVPQEPVKPVKAKKSRTKK